MSLRLCAVAALTVIWCEIASAQSGAPCRRPAPRPVQKGEVIVIAQAPPPCRLVFSETPVVLRTDAAGTVSDIGLFVSRAPDGRFVSYTGRGELTVWNTDGSFHKQVGRPGSGPGEFAIGPLSVLFDSAGRTYVRDNNARWTILSPAYEYLRNVGASGMSYVAEHATFLPDGRLLTGGMSRQPSFSFHVYDFAPGASAAGAAGAASAPGGPALVQSFGEVPMREREYPASSRYRKIAYGGNGTIWAGPPLTVGRGYELEQWTGDGQLLRTIRRTASWYPPGADIPEPRRGEGVPTRPPTQVTFVDTDGTGLLLVGVARANDKWRPVSARDREAYVANREQSTELYIDVIDAAAGVLLATIGPTARADIEGVVGSGLISGTRFGFRRGLSADDLREVRITEWRLVQR